MIIITGASKNIGRYLFEKFKMLGEQVIGVYNSTSIGFDSDLDSYYKVDITDIEQVRQWRSLISKQLSHIVLINCAGVSYAGFAHKSDIEQWKRVIDVNLTGTFNVIRELLPYMRNEGFGRIINFSSVVAVYPTPGVSAYAASKAGLVGLTRSLAIENASKGITANAINLGYSSIGMGVDDVPSAYQQKLLNTIPMGRFCSPEEIFSTVQYLISTPYVNGADLNINGGLI